MKIFENHHAGQVERLARRRADHAEILIFLLYRGEHRMLSLEYEVVVDLIADYLDAVFHAEISHPGQLLLREHSSGRVVGIAEKEQLHIMIHDLLFKSARSI